MFEKALCLRDAGGPSVRLMRISFLEVAQIVGTAPSIAGLLGDVIFMEPHRLWLARDLSLSFKKEIFL